MGFSDLPLFVRDLTRWQRIRNRLLIWWRKLWYRGDPEGASWVSSWAVCTACGYECAHVYPVTGNLRRWLWECPRCLGMTMKDAHRIPMPPGAP